MAERQTVLGVCFKAVKEMADSVPQPVYMRWLAMAAKIQQRNEEMNRKCAEVYEAIRKEGFECAVLKGQGVAELYNLNVNLGLNHNNLIKRLGMARFEKAMKWVIGYVFEEKDIEDGRKCGKMLLEYIMDGGNFGKHKATTVASRHTHIGRFINQLTHDIRLMRYYPSEAVWAPLSMIRV